MLCSVACFVLLTFILFIIRFQLGIFGLARALFGIVFHEVDSPRGWVSDVRLFTAADEATGEELGKLYLDPFFRGTKARYFFLSPLARNSMFLGAPIQPTAWSDEPTPLKFEDALSLVHELGHALHFLLAKNQLVATHHMPHEVSEVMPQVCDYAVCFISIMITFYS